MRLDDVYEIRINGNNITDYVESFSRSVSICEGIENLNLVLDISLGIDYVNIFDKIEIYENGSKVKTFYVDSIDIPVPDYVLVISATDMKRVRDYFIDYNYIITYPSTPRYWIQKFINDAGANVIFTTSEDGGYLSNNTSLGMTSLYDQMQTLLQIAGWYMRTDTDGNIVVGDLVADRNPSGVIRNVLSFSRNRDDKNMRNRGVVWGSYNSQRKYWVFADVYKPTPWDIDYKDKRTVVVFNSNIDSIYTANSIANKIVDTFNQLDDVITLQVAGVSGLNIGDTVYILLPYFRGNLLLTSYNKEVSKRGAIETLVFNERCPRLFAYWGWGTDNYYLASDKGIYIKPLITESGQMYSWYDYNLGLPEERNTPVVKASHGLLATYVESGSAYYRDTILETPWVEIPYSGHVAGVANTGQNIYVGYNFSGNYEIVKVGYFGNTSTIVTGSGNIIDIDALYNTVAYTITYSGITWPNYSFQEIYDYIMDEFVVDESHQIYFTSSFLQDIEEEFQSALEIIEFDPVAYIGTNNIHGRMLHSKDKDYYIYQDLDTDEFGVVVSDRNANYTKNIIPFSYKFRGNAIINKDGDKIDIIGITENKDEIYLCTVDTNDFSIYCENMYTCHDDESIEDYIIGKYSSAGFLVVKEKNGKKSAKIIFRTPFTINKVYEIPVADDIARNGKAKFINCCDENILLFFGSYKLLVDLGNNKFENIQKRFVCVIFYDDISEIYKTVEMDGYFSFYDINSYLGNIGVDKSNNKIYIMNLERFGLIIDLNTYDVSYGNLDFPFTSNDGSNVNTFRFVESNDKLYMVVSNWRQPFNLLYIYNITDKRFENVSFTDSSIIYIDDGEYIISTDNGFKIIDNYGNILYEYTIGSGKTVKKYVTDYRAANVYGGVFNFINKDTNREVIIHPKGYQFDNSSNHGIEVYMFSNSSTFPQKILRLGGRYKVNVGSSLLYLYPEEPSPTYLATFEKNKFKYVNNGINLVTMPREGQIISESGNMMDRGVFAIASNKSNITSSTVYDIINSEYFNISSIIEVPTSGNVIEVSNYKLEDEDEVSRIIISNGKDKVFETFGGTDFSEVINNLIDDFEINTIHYIAIDDDL